MIAKVVWWTNIQASGFLKNGPIPASFLFIFVLFLLQFQYKLKKRVDGVLGIRTRGRRLVGADKTTEIWWPPWVYSSVVEHSTASGLLIKKIIYLVHNCLKEGVFQTMGEFVFTKTLEVRKGSFKLVAGGREPLSSG